LGAVGRAELSFRTATPQTTPRDFLPTSISSSTMSSPTNDPFPKSFYSPETRLHSSISQSGNITSLKLARPSSAPPILIKPSSTIHAADRTMLITGQITFLPVFHEVNINLFIETQLQAIGLGSPRREWLSARNMLLLSPLVCIHPKLLLFITDDSDIGLSSYSPTSAMFASVMDLGLMPVDTEMTVACQLPFNLSV
jgi:hypothetical protein